MQSNHIFFSSNFENHIIFIVFHTTYASTGYIKKCKNANMGHNA